MNNKFCIVAALSLVVSLFTLAGCPGEDSASAHVQVTAYQACEQFYVKIGKRLEKLGLGDLGTQYNSDGTQIESDSSRISRCEGNMGKVANKDDLKFIVHDFVPCFERALGLNGSDQVKIEQIKHCINQIDANMSPAANFVFRNYVLNPAAEDGSKHRDYLNGLARDAFGKLDQF